MEHTTAMQQIHKKYTISTTKAYVATPYKGKLSENIRQILKPHNITNSSENANTLNIPAKIYKIPLMVYTRFGLYSTSTKAKVRI